MYSFFLLNRRIEMPGKFSKTSYTSLNDIPRFTRSERGPHLFHSLPIRIDPLLNVSNGFVLPVRFGQMPEPAPPLEVRFNRLTPENVGGCDCSPPPSTMETGCSQHLFPHRCLVLPHLCANHTHGRRDRLPHATSHISSFSSTGRTITRRGYASAPCSSTPTRRFPRNSDTYPPNP